MVCIGFGWEDEIRDAWWRRGYIAGSRGKPAPVHVEELGSCEGIEVPEWRGLRYPPLIALPEIRFISWLLLLELERLVPIRESAVRCVFA